jgi:LPXTG-motif cell wall-anchored protein
MIWLLPAASLGSGANDALKSTTQQLGESVGQTVAPVQRSLRATTEKTKAALDRTKAALERARREAAKRAAAAAGTRVASPDPTRQPPQHGANPHGQGGVAVVDLNPSAERPLGANPDGSDSGPEDVVVGRARGEQSANGSFHGHITILSLFGNELSGVDTAPGETKNGPLQPVQEGILDPLCTATNNQVCLSVLTADSQTTATGSRNDFAVARAQILGLGANAAESGGTIGQTSDCQTSVGSSSTANVTSSSGAIATAANSVATSNSCKGKDPQVTRDSRVLGLGGTTLPLPAAGCENGAPDTVTDILPPVARLVCNADDVAGAAVVRDALDVFVLSSGNSSLVREATSSSEAISVAPKGPETNGPQCSDGVDNDGDGKVDGADPGCHSDGNPNNPASFVPSDNDETDPTPTGPSGDQEGGKPECSNNKDDDGDGLVDEDDPGCHSDGNPNNASSYNPDDDDESDDGGAGNGAPEAGAGDAGQVPDTLPFTGASIVGLALAGLLMLAGGLLLRRREDALGRS